MNHELKKELIEFASNLNEGQLKTLKELMTVRDENNTEALSKIVGDIIKFWAVSYAENRSPSDTLENDKERTTAFYPSVTEKDQNTTEYTTRGTKRIRQPKRDAEEIAEDPIDTLTLRLPSKIKKKFNQFVDSHPELTKTRAAQEAFLDLFEKYEK